VVPPNPYGLHTGVLGDPTRSALMRRPLDIRRVWSAPA
jgi:hypothetical protein